MTKFLESFMSGGGEVVGRADENLCAESARLAAPVSHREPRPGPAASPLGRIISHLCNTPPAQPTSDFSCRFLSLFPHVPNTPMCGLCVTTRFRAALSSAFFSRTFSTSSMLSAWQSQPCLS